MSNKFQTHARTSRRVFVQRALSVATALAGAQAGVARAQAVSSAARPIRIIVPATAGDGSDVIARVLARHMSEAMATQFVIENRPGAGGSIAADAVAKSAPDGHTLMLGNASSHAVTPSLYATLPYDTLRDFLPLSLLASAANVLVVGPQVRAENFAEFARLARSQPGKFDIASAGNGSLSHLSAELMKSMAKLHLVHIPYRGAAPALADVAGGQVAAMLINIPSALPLVKAGKLRAFAVSSRTRSALLPEVPTLAESGLTGYETYAWFGLFAPAGTSTEIATRLNNEAQKALQKPDVREALTRLGAEVANRSGDAFAQFVRAEMSKYAQVIRSAGIKNE